MPIPSFLSEADAAMAIQRWWRNIGYIHLSEIRHYVSEWMAYEAGEYEKCECCGGNEAFCDCESDLWEQYDKDDLRKIDLYNRRFNGGF